MMLTKDDKGYKLTLQIDDSELNGDLYKEMQDKFTKYGAPIVDYAWYIDNGYVQLDIYVPDEDPDISDNDAMEELLGVML